MALSGATTPGQGGPGSNGNKGVLHIPQSSSITGTSASDCLVSYPGWGSYSSAEKQSVYSTALANWARNLLDCKVWAGFLIIQPLAELAQVYQEEW